MARFNAAVMDGAADAKFQNRYNYLLDLLDMGYMVEKRIDGVPIRLEMSPSVGFAFYQGGGATGWVYRGGLAVVDGELSLVTDVLKGPNTTDAYAKLTSSTLGTEEWASFDFYAYNAGSPVNYLKIAGYYDSADSEYFAELLIDVPTGESGYLALIAGESSGGSLIDGAYVSVDRWGDPKAYVGVVDSNIDTYFYIMNDDFKTYYNGNPMLAWSSSAFTYKSNTVWHSGNDGSGSTLDADMLDGIHASNFASQSTFVYPDIVADGTVSPQLGEYKVGIVGVVWYGGTNCSAIYLVHSWVSGNRYFQQIGTTQGASTTPASTAPVLNADGTFTIKNTNTGGLTLSIKATFVRLF